MLQSSAKRSRPPPRGLVSLPSIGRRLSVARPSLVRVHESGAAAVSRAVGSGNRRRGEVSSRTQHRGHVARGVTTRGFGATHAVTVGNTWTHEATIFRNAESGKPRWWSGQAAGISQARTRWESQGRKLKHAPRVFRDGSGEPDAFAPV